MADPNGSHPEPMALRRRRDSQQWLLDWMTKTNGRVQNFEYDTRVLPPEVKTYRQIPKVLERYARHVEQVARAAEAAGHRETAHTHYWRAADWYRDAQHPIFVDDHPDKIYLHGKLQEMFAKVIELSDYPMELVEIPWEGVSIQGVLHLTGKPASPTILHIPGMDQTKETFPDPTDNAYVRRGLNVLVLDGPGQGTSNLRKIRVTADNYERAASAAIDYLQTRPEVDPDRIGLCGISMGSFWAMRTAARDPRVKALATASACFTSKRAIFEESSPRFKQMFMYMAGYTDERAFDAMAATMTMDGYAANITCPSLTCIGEYDPLCHLDEAIPIWEQIRGPRELWILEDDFHSPPKIEGLGGSDVYYYLADFLRDALNGAIEADRNIVRVIPKKTGAGPYEPPVRGVWLPDRLLD
ncbi:MAG: alpha/beta hydrolase, partial [Dehalococcoidia bacterium]|nr:alpha/beta hydrolase [Dehalococcoidia bacterium]